MTASSIAADGMSGPSLPAVLFDLDGTLIDSIELILSSMRHAFAKFGRPVPSDAEWLEGVGIPLFTMFRRYAESDAQLGELIDGYREYQLAHHDRLVRGYDAVSETLALLEERGHPLAVVTSKSDVLARRGLRQAGIDRHFDVIVSCDSTSRHKPHPEPVLLALDRLQCPAERAFFVGDSVHDIEAGNAAGVRTVAALWGPFTRDQLSPARPRHFMGHIAELPKLVTEL